MAEPQKPIRTSLFFYVPVAIAGMLLVFWVFSSNYKKGEQAGLTAPPPPEGSQAAAPQINERALAKDSGLAAKGKTLFQINCASCHGSDGHGNGDRAASLNPKPRNFHEEKFKFGNDIVSIHATLLKGSPGTSMPSFALLPPEDVWALAHFVETQIPDAPPITDALVAQLPEGGTAGGTAGSGQAPAAAADTMAKGSGERVPILFAMDRIAHEPAAAGPASNKVVADLPGTDIYLNRCAACHGEHGEGKRVKVVNVAPYSWAYTASLINPKASWMNNRNEFGQIVVRGLPGRLMPGIATLTKQQIDDLYSYVRSLPPSH
jgi:mono/diheme cytochrome c family protein